MSVNKIAVTYKIDNVYEGGAEIQTTIHAEIPPPPMRDESSAYDDWEYENVFQYTGTGREDGDAAYFVEVVASSAPELIPVGEVYEFGL